MANDPFPEPYTSLTQDSHYLVSIIPIRTACCYPPSITFAQLWDYCWWQ